MSMAACLADTNDLALDPATTAEDTQNTQQSIMSYTGSVFLLSACLTICLTASLLSISHAYLLPSLHLCHLSFLSPSSRLPKIQSFTPNTFFTSYRSIWASSRFRSSHNYSLCPSQSPFPCLPLSLSPIFHPPHPPCLSLPISTQPTALLSLGRGEQCQPTWGPSAVPAEKAGSTREHP